MEALRLKFKIICNSTSINIISSLLNERNLGPISESKLEMVEKGYEASQAAYLVFDSSRMNEISSILDLLSKDTKIFKNSIAIHENEQVTLIQSKEVLYFQTEGNQVIAYTLNGRGEIKSRLYELEEQLSPARFARISKSAIVNLGAVREVRPWFGRNILLRFGAENRQVEVSRSFVSALKAKLGL